MSTLMQLPSIFKGFYYSYQSSQGQFQFTSTSWREILAVQIKYLPNMSNYNRGSDTRRDKNVNDRTFSDPNSTRRFWNDLKNPVA